MNVDLEDGCCRECGGQLKVVGCDDCTLTVECECGESYDVESDAFGDGCMKYQFDFLVQQRMNIEEGSDGSDNDSP